MTPETVSAKKLPLWVPVLLAGVLIALDQWLKWWTVSNLEVAQPVIPVIPWLVSLTLTYNTGAAWSLFSGLALPLAALRMLVGIGLLVSVVYRPPSRFLSIVISIISAGAIGNAIDGLRLGRVVDMLYSPALSSVTRALKAGEFPIFNIADCCVVVGVILLFLSFLFTPQSPKRTSE